ncbi:MAG: hypothetical protein WC551_10390 [Patescibacteria group bacterium]
MKRPAYSTWFGLHLAAAVITVALVFVVGWACVQGVKITRAISSDLAYDASGQYEKDAQAIVEKGGH